MTGTSGDAAKGIVIVETTVEMMQMDDTLEGDQLKGAYAELFGKFQQMLQQQREQQERERQAQKEMNEQQERYQQVLQKLQEHEQNRKLQQQQQQKRQRQYQKTHQPPPSGIQPSVRQRQHQQTDQPSQSVTPLQGIKRKRGCNGGKKRREWKKKNQGKESIIKNFIFH